MMERVPCDLCGADDSETVYGGSAWRQPTPDGLALVRCRACGLMYQSPRPSVNEMDSYYPADYMAFRPAIQDERWGLMRWMRRRKLIQRRKWIEHYSGRTSGRVLDVGCATGLFLKEMTLAGWEAWGVEPTASAAQYARAHMGLEVFGGMLEEAPYPPESVDVVTFWDVLEHTFSPTDALTRAATLLRPGGWVALDIPNWHSFERKWFGPFWSGFDPPRHLYVFTRSTLTRLLRKAGLQPVGWVSFMPSYFSFIISVDRWLQSVSPGWRQPVNRVLNFPGVRLLFEPMFTTANWFNCSGLITVFARKVMLW